MPNLTDTQLLSAIAKATQSIMGAAEFRDYEHSTTKRLLNSQNDVFRNVNKLKQSDEQPTKVDLISRVYTASGTAKVAAHAAAAFPDSFVKDITYLKRVQTFKVSYKQADNNRFGYEEILQSELKNKLQSMYLDLSTYNIAWLDANRSQVGVDSLMLFDDVTNNQFDNLLADRDYLFDNTIAALKKNRYVGMIDMIGDQKITQLHRRIGRQGDGNSVNLAPQIKGIDYIDEPQIALAATSTAYAWQKGMVGMTTWNEKINRMGVGAIGNTEGLFTTMVDPVFGHKHDVHIKRAVADTSGSGGNSQDVVDEYEISTIFTVQGAWESTANATPIFKIVQANV